MLLGSITLYVIALLIQVYDQKDLYPINKHVLGIDIKDFYDALVAYKSGNSPYSSNLFVTPPTILMLLWPLTILSLSQAIQLYFLINLLVIGLSVLIGWKIFGCQSSKINIWIVLIIIFLSHPTIFLLDRGNIDGFVVLSFSLGLLFLKSHRQYLSGGFFGLAIGLKIYPVLVLIPIILSRRWKLLAGALVVISVSFLVFPKLWIEFLNLRLVPLSMLNEVGAEDSRFNDFRMYENGSIANLFYGIIHYIKSVFHPKASIPEQTVFIFSNALYMVLLFLLVIKDFRSSKKNDVALTYAIALYIPFMIAVPKLAYLYEYVLLIPLMWAIFTKEHWSNSMKYSSAIILAFILVNLNTITAEKLLETDRYHFLPSLGLFILTIMAILSFNNLVAGQLGFRHSEFD